MITLNGGDFIPVPRGGAAECHARREDPCADCEQMQIIGAVATDATRDPQLNVVTPPVVTVPPEL